MWSILDQRWKIILLEERCIIRKEVQKLWIPSIIFGNTENNDVIASDPLAKVTISKEGVFELSGETVVDEINIFTIKLFHPFSFNGF